MKYTVGEPIFPRGQDNSNLPAQLVAMVASLAAPGTVPTVRVIRCRCRPDYTGPCMCESPADFGQER